MASTDSYPSLDSLLGQRELPALPQSATQLMSLSQDPDNGPAEFAVPIESDPGLASQVLRFVNSSYFGFSREISSLRLAITLVGIRTIKNFVLWNAVFSLMPKPNSGPFDLRQLWRDSLERGLFARGLGLELGLRDAEDLFAAALLQDMAVPLLAQAHPVAYAQLFQQREGGRVRLSEAEQAHFGWTHAEGAALLARRWKLPEELAELVAAHVQPITAGDPPARLAIRLSSLLPASVDDGQQDGARLLKSFARWVPAEIRLGDVLASVDRAFDDLGPLLRVSKRSRSLAALLEVSPLG